MGTLRADLVANAELHDEAMASLAISKRNVEEHIAALALKASGGAAAVGRGCRRPPRRPAQRAAVEGTMGLSFDAWNTTELHSAVVSELSEGELQVLSTAPCRGERGIVRSSASAVSSDASARGGRPSWKACCQSGGWLALPVEGGSAARAARGAHGNGRPANAHGDGGVRPVRITKVTMATWNSHALHSADVVRRRARRAALRRISRAHGILLVQETNGTRHDTEATATEYRHTHTHIWSMRRSTRRERLEGA